MWAGGFFLLFTRDFFLHDFNDYNLDYIVTKQNRQLKEADNQKIDNCISDLTLSYHKDTETLDTSVSPN